MKIALLFRSYGPYHLARLAALRKLHNVHALEFCALDPDYNWKVDGKKSTERVENIHNSRELLFSELDRYHPDIVAVPGWSEPLALQTLIHCYRRGFPVLMMSESRREDASRFL